MSNKGGVCIVVVNYNGLEISKSCLDSLLQLKYDSFCIVFVDNGSTDGSGAVIEKEYCDKVIYLPLPQNLGVTGGNNAGIDYALQHGYEYILFLNNDTLVNEHLLEKLVQTSKEFGNSLVVPKIICYYDQKRLDHFIGSEIDWWTAQPLGYVPYPIDSPKLNIKAEITIASTCCLLVPSESIAKIGQMDEKYFMYYDDSDFTIRASRAGYRIMYEPSVTIYHKCNTSTRDKQPSFFEFYLVSRNVVYFYNKLCRNIFIRLLFLAKHFLMLLLIFTKAFLYKDSVKLRVLKFIFRDILNGTMGAVPDLRGK